MQIGDILVIQGKGIISKLIQWITGSKWSHVALCLGAGLILEIDWNTKATIVKEHYIQDGYEYMVLRDNLPLTTEQKQSIAYTALRYHQTGHHYDWSLILALLIKTKFPHTHLAHYLNGKCSFICTELVERVRQDAGLVLFPEREGDIYPYEFLTCKKLHIVESSHKMLG